MVVATGKALVFSLRLAEALEAVPSGDPSGGHPSGGDPSRECYSGRAAAEWRALASLDAEDAAALEAAEPGALPCPAELWSRVAALEGGDMDPREALLEVHEAVCG